ncbi:MAG: YceI family protein, partial [Longimicrobiaceae bacterium]
MSWLRQIFLLLAGMVLQLLFCVLPLPAQTNPTRFTLDAEESRVWFGARANMGGFRGEAWQVEGWAEVADTVTFRDARGTIELQVASLRTGIALRDRHLRDEMAADSFPVIRFVLSRIAAPP